MPFLQARISCKPCFEQQRSSFRTRRLELFTIYVRFCAACSKKASANTRGVEGCCLETGHVRFHRILARDADRTFIPKDDPAVAARTKKRQQVSAERSVHRSDCDSRLYVESGERAGSHPFAHAALSMPFQKLAALQQDTPAGRATAVVSRTVGKFRTAGVKSYHVDEGSLMAKSKLFLQNESRRPPRFGVR